MKHVRYPIIALFLLVSSVHVNARNESHQSQMDTIRNVERMLVEQRPDREDPYKTDWYVRDRKAELKKKLQTVASYAKHSSKKTTRIAAYHVLVRARQYFSGKLSLHENYKRARLIRTWTSDAFTVSEDLIGPNKYSTVPVQHAMTRLLLLEGYRTDRDVNREKLSEQLSTWFGTSFHHLRQAGNAAAEGNKSEARREYKKARTNAARAFDGTRSYSRTSASKSTFIPSGYSRLKFSVNGNEIYTLITEKQYQRLRQNQFVKFDHAEGNGWTFFVRVPKQNPSGDLDNMQTSETVRAKNPSK